MKSGDLLTVIGGIAIVIVIALIANPHYLSGIVPKIPGPTATQTPVATPPPTPVPLVAIPTLNQNEPVPVPTPAPPYRILYTDKPLSYPVYTLPENMNVFGASDIPLRSSGTVTFAYIEETRGGLTRTFTVPYPVWIINTTVTSEINPQYGNFRMVLCYASNGTIIQGQEILNRGTAYHLAEVSNTPVYMIISTASIDRYRITLETPRDYYETNNAELLVINKIIGMRKEADPLTTTLLAADKTGDYMAMNASAENLRSYLDQNLPELKQLAGNANTEKAAAQEYVLFFEDLRTGADYNIQAVDRYYSGNPDQSALLLNERNRYFDSASRELATAQTLFYVK